MESHEKKSDEADAQADKLEDEGERVDKKIGETKSDWEAKKGDLSVPGAVPDPDDEEDKPTEAESEGDESADSADQ